MLAFFGEGRGFGDLAANDVTRDDDDDAEQEGDPPAPGVERIFGHEMRERQEDRGGEDLPGLHALKGEAGQKAASAERCVLENHGTGAGYLAGDGEALDETQRDQKYRGEHADLLVGRQDSDGHRREPHEEHAQQQHRLAAVGVAPVPEEEGADGPRDVADAIGRQRGDNGDLGVA